MGCVAMKSIVLYTEEMDDLDTGIQELIDQLNEHELKKNSAAIMFAHPDTNFKELMAGLKKYMHFPIIGCTAMSMFTEAMGYTTQGISLQIFTGDDVYFQAGITSEMNPENMKDEIQSMYNDLSAKQEEKEKLILAYANIIKGVTGDRFIEYLDEVSGGSPVFGGISSDSFSFDDCRVIYDENVHQYAMAVLMISGNIRPSMIYEFSIDREAEYSAIVTDASENEVRSLNNKSFIESMEKIGMRPDYEDAFVESVGMPLMSTYETPEGDKIQVMRHLNSVNRENGAGIFLGEIKEGSLIHVCLMNRAEIKKSVSRAIHDCFRILKSNPDYHYSTLLLTSCASRIMTFVNDIAEEANSYVEIIPPTMTMSGFYSFGEFCPEKGNVSGKMHNIFQNTTFCVLMM